MAKTIESLYPAGYETMVEYTYDMFTSLSEMMNKYAGLNIECVKYSIIFGDDCRYKCDCHLQAPLSETCKPLQTSEERDQYFKYFDGGVRLIKSQFEDMFPGVLLVNLTCCSCSSGVEYERRCE